MEESNDKKAIQELKQFIEQLNQPKEYEIFEQDPVFTETLKKIEDLENEEASKN